MTSVIATAAQAAHSIAASFLATAQIQPGATIPPQLIKEDAPDQTSTLTLRGKNIIIGVPGAFTGTCSAQIPEYIKNYGNFKEKGIEEIFVVAVNDVFVTKAWKEKLAPQGTKVRFIADDKGTFASTLGLVFDATPLLGSLRSKRYVIIAEDEKILFIAVEEDPGQLTITDANTILSQL